MKVFLAIIFGILETTTFPSAKPVFMANKNVALF
jgi:hypothetical protein